GHEAHFGQVTDAFLEYLGGKPMPHWEKANMLAKYYVTTRALEICRQGN
ncbi:MAG: oxidoreductase, partial [Candidatus Helarchaeota archaeon]|nr:oxidoreductase [Candidatus Helarchaeota archaeon]